MMQLNEILSLECTKISVPCTSKKRALEMLSQIAANYGNLDPEPLFECLLEREKVGSTAIGNGVAMPHCKIPLSQYEQAQYEQLQADIALSNKALSEKTKDEINAEQASSERNSSSPLSTSNAPKAVAVLITCEEPVEFDAPDNRPIQVLFALFVPEDQCETHMQTLTLLSKVLSEPATVKKLRYAESDQVLHNILNDAYFEMTQNENENETDDKLYAD